MTSPPAPQGQDLGQFSLRQLFGVEAKAQCQVLTRALLEIERGSTDAAVLEGAMRAAHSIKGAAAIVDLGAAVQLAHAMEDALIGAQRGSLTLSPARIDVLLNAVDLMLALSQADESGQSEWLERHDAQLSTASEALRSLGELACGGDPPTPAAAAPAPIAAPAARAQHGAAQGDDRLLALASQARVHAHQLQSLGTPLQRFKRLHEGLAQALDALHQGVLLHGDSALRDLSLAAVQKLDPVRQLAHGHMAELDAFARRSQLNADRLLDAVIDLRMRPFGDAVQAFPRMVRDLARNLGKQATLHIDGLDTLVDRDILAHIDNPLNHLLRNALDHGIELPHERVRSGKPAEGTIRIDARHRGGMLSIEVSDDGRGIDCERIRANVLARGLASAPMAQALSPAELLEFLFLPAFSLKDKADELSGRGVGLDVVLDTIRRQNGSVRIGSQPGRGFRTTITLPLTQSVQRVLVFSVQGEAYAIPIAAIERVLRVDAGAIGTLENKQFVEHEGEHIGLVGMAQLLELGEARTIEGELSLLVVGSGARRYGLVVDAIGHEQSLAVQPLTPLFGKLRNVAAGALLDDGAVVLILDVPDLLLSVDKLLRAGALHALAAAAPAASARRVLVVDDSLTVREMERKLLATRGYAVEVAVDGMDGWNMVRTNSYDLVITDVDMPRMDGIELVTHIRQDARLNALPVMIVSYKDRPEDRSRGLAAGADYYLGKGSFHDERLLEAVAELIGAAQ